MKCCKVGRKDRIIRTCRQQHAYAANPLILLCTCNERNRSSATEQRDELASSHGAPPPAVGSWPRPDDDNTMEPGSASHRFVDRRIRAWPRPRTHGGAGDRLPRSRFIRSIVIAADLVRLAADDPELVAAVHQPSSGR